MKLRPHRPKRRQNILVADDMPAIRHVISCVLASDGYDVDARQRRLVMDSRAPMAQEPDWTI
jgi:CheY-like chemotaxis protein